MNSFTPCRKCAALEGPVPGFYYIENKRFVKECSCHIRWQRQVDLERRCEDANVWFENRGIADYKGDKSREDLAAFETYIKNFDRFKDKMLYMYGPNGTQKTTIAMWGARQLLEKGHTVLYTLMETLSVTLAPDFAGAKDGKREEFIERAMNVDLLIVDEAFDRSKVTLYKSGYQIPFLDRFFRERFDVGKRGILFVSNKKSFTISESGFGESLHSLVNRNTASSSLSFTDTFIEEAHKINPRGLFENV